MSEIREREVFQEAVATLARAQNPPPVSERDLAGCIQLFELAFETGWKALRRRLLDVGIRADSPRSAIAEAFRAGFLIDEEGWVEMLRDRKLTTHTYNRDLAEAMVARIASRYLPLLEQV